MNGMRTNVNFPFAPSGEDVEIEVLQADVMRFMAILGFILTIIFALVQSLPFTPQKSQPTAERKELLSRDITGLRRHVMRQLEVLQDLRQEIEFAKTLKKTALAQAYDATQLKEKLLEETAQVKSALDESYKRLEIAESQVEKRSRSLRMIRLRIEKERGHLEALQSRISQVLQGVKTAIEPRNRVLAESKNPRKQTGMSEQTTNERTRARATRIQKELARIQAQRESIVTEAKKPASREQAALAKPDTSDKNRVPQRKGFTLKFDSDAAFHRLLKSKAVGFFVMVGTKAWQAHLTNEIPRFVSSRLPSRYYQMDSMTVPKKFAVGFRRVVAAHKRDSIIWGVVLPNKMIGDVKKEISGKIGGDVVISGNGEVRMENANP